MVSDVDGLARPTPSPADLARVRAGRIARGVVSTWAGSGTGPGHHAVRTQRLRVTWPQLADFLDHLAAAADGLPADVSNLGCPTCRRGIERVTADVDPRTATRRYRIEPCGHHTDRDTALNLYQRGATAHTVPITGATLVAAERTRQRVEEGHTAAADTAYDRSELAWAAWSLLDRAAPDADPDDSIPGMWPWPPEAWPADKTRLRRLIIAGALIAAEIDRSLAAGETP